ncbi:MAG: FeS assembly SUF system protein, partial [Paenibacillus sp. RIFOXYA1_FULL_44_5]
NLLEYLKDVYDPELGVNIIDLGLVYELTEQEGNVYVQMTLTTPGCPMHDTMIDGVKRRLQQLPDIHSVQVDLVWNPPWSPERMSDEAKAQLGYR